MMQRRAFAFGAGAACLAAGLSAAGLSAIGRPAVAQTVPRFEQGTPTPLRLRFENGEIATLRALEVAAGGRWLGLRWSQHLPTFFEDRLDLSGLAPALFRTPFAHRWRAARPVGGVHRIGARLVLRADAPGAFDGRAVVVAAGRYSWDLPGTLAAMPPGAGAGAGVGAGSGVGAARLGQDGQLLILLRAQPLI